MNEERILVVDDEPVILASIKRLCDDQPWSIDGVQDGHEAIRHLGHEPYQLVVCDIKMPGMTGFDLLEWLHDHHVSTPTIMISGYCTIEYTVKSLFEGAIDFLPKPFTYDELLSCLKRGLVYEQVIRDSPHHHWSDPMPYIPCPPKFRRFGYLCWTHLEPDGSVLIGATDLFMRTIGSLREVKCFEPGFDLEQGSPCAQFFTEDPWVHTLPAPLSGEIIEQNEALQSNNQIEKDPYFRGWLYRMIPNNLAVESQSLIPCSSDRL